MARYWIAGLALVVLALTVALVGTALSQQPSPMPSQLYSVAGPASSSSAGYPASSSSSTQRISIFEETPKCVVYSLHDLGDEPELGKWLVETIPAAVDPNSFGQGAATVRYYAPRHVLMVCHTAAGQAKVERFLKELKQSLPQHRRVNTAQTSSQNQTIMQAAFRSTDSSKADKLSTEPANYPVPAHQAQSPKHLFHFIIRYEGDGVIDSNVVKAMKTQFGEKKEDKEVEPKKPPCPTCAPSADAAPATLPAASSLSNSADPAGSTTATVKPEVKESSQKEATDKKTSEEEEDEKP